MDILDFHAHILPCVDHGSSSLETTIYQLETARKNGVTRIIATPHFYPQRENVDRFLLRRDRSYTHLEKNTTPELPQVILGAEVLICDNIEEMPLLDKLCIQGTRALLLELPFSSLSSNDYISVKNLILCGYNVILAHADRYDPNDISRLVDIGAKIQLNASSLCNLFMPKHFLNWLEAFSVVAIGSDIHGKDDRVYKKFHKAKNKIPKYISYIKEYSDNIWNLSLNNKDDIV